MSSPRIAIVVPCYDEAARLPAEAFVKFSEAHPDTGFTFVDDASTDGTAERLRELVERAPDRCRLLRRPRNGGKARAVWTGMQQVLSEEPVYAGYWDADLATPLEELPRFARILDDEPGCELVMGSRVALLGRRIERSALRHYVGRVFATGASLTLGLPVYDTQCGAKLFRVGPGMREAFAEPFRAGWSFDVELLARRLRARRAQGLPDEDGWVREVPLRRWTDVAGSKVRPLDFFRAFAELWRIRRSLADPRDARTSPR